MLIVIAAVYSLSGTSTFAKRVSSSEPFNLNAEAISGQIHLDWDAPTINVASVTGYIILRGKIQTASRLVGLFSIADTGSKETEYIDADIVPGTEYTYCVQAIRGGVKSALSNCVDLIATIQTVDSSSSPISVESSPSCFIESVIKDRILIENLIGEGYETYEEAHDTYPSVSFTMNPDCPIPPLMPATSSERSIGPGFNRPKKAATSTLHAQRSTSGSESDPAPGSAQNQDPDPTPDSSKKPQPDPTPTPKHDSKSSPQTLTGEEACYADPNVHYKWISCPRSYWAPGHYPW